jgi:hypothetical protein
VHYGLIPGIHAQVDFRPRSGGARRGAGTGQQPELLVLGQVTLSLVL